MGFWENLFRKKEPKPKQEWRHVTLKEFNISRGNGEEEGILYCHFYEADNGERKVFFETSYNDDNGQITVEKVKHLSVYQKVIQRWLDGRYDPEIPRFNDIPEEETVHALKGKIE